MAGMLLLCCTSNLISFLLRIELYIKQLAWVYQSTYSTLSLCAPPAKAQCSCSTWSPSQSSDQHHPLGLPWAPQLPHPGTGRGCSLGRAQHSPAPAHPFGAGLAQVHHSPSSCFYMGGQLGNQNGLFHVSVPCSLLGLVKHFRR